MIEEELERKANAKVSDVSKWINVEQDESDNEITWNEREGDYEEEEEETFNKINKWIQVEGGREKRKKTVKRKIKASGDIMKWFG